MSNILVYVVSSGLPIFLCIMFYFQRHCSINDIYGTRYVVILYWLKPSFIVGNNFKSGEVLLKILFKCDCFLLRILFINPQWLVLVVCFCSRFWNFSELMKILKIIRGTFPTCVFVEVFELFERYRNSHVTRRSFSITTLFSAILLVIKLTFLIHMS